MNGEPTLWVSPTVAVPKKDTDVVRTSVDMREANKAILHERHQMPTVEELTTDLKGAKIFSKIDLTQDTTTWNYKSHQDQLQHSALILASLVTKD